MSDGEGTRAAELPLAVVGAGLAGGLMACLLALRGRPVHVFERRSDPRMARHSEGRSINLALSHRGLRALELADLTGRVLGDAIPMRGRMMHAPDGTLSFQPYGTEEDQVIYSVSRGGLNRILIDRLDELPGTELHFDTQCVDVDLDRAELTLESAGSRRERRFRALVGADGAFSAVRSAMAHRTGFNYEQRYLTHGYKELTIPPTPAGEFAMEPHALHIWPRGGFMMIALPNADRSYTCTLFWPLEGEGSFATIQSERELLTFFGQQFPDALPHLPDLVPQYQENPTGSLVTIRCSPWHYRDRVILIGDAAHAVVPFYGQGMNASFEDCRLLDEAMAADGLERAFERFSRSRKPDADALADLALENYRVMRERVASRGFLLGRALGRALHRVLPHFLPLYTMVTFTSLPYAEAVRRWERQRRVLWLAVALSAILIVSLCSFWWLSRAP
jgi:kynurenine 3-monooxygenase